MIISFTGPQCSGKTTCLTYLNNFSPVFFDTQPEPYFPKEILDVENNNIEFVQSLILNHHIEVLLKYDKFPRCVNLAMDRCIVDAYVYTDYIAKTKGLPEQLLRYSSYLLSKLITKYDIIFYCKPTGIPLVDNGVRSTDEQYRDDITKSFDLFFSKPINCQTKIVTLEGSFEQRMDIVKQTLTNYAK